MLQLLRSATVVPINPESFFFPCVYFLHENVASYSPAMGINMFTSVEVRYVAPTIGDTGDRFHSMGKGGGAKTVPLITTGLQHLLQ